MSAPTSIQERASGAAPRPAGAPPQPVQRSVTRALRGMDYNAGAALLAPQDVQMEASASAPGESTACAWTPEAQLAAYDATRTLGWNPEWVTALQAMLGVDPKGVASRELADAIAELEKRAGRPLTGRVDGANTAWLEAEFPVLTGVPREVDIGEAPAAGAKARGNGSVAEDGPIRRSNQGSSYADYAATTLRSGTFCGHPVIGHPVFLGRLRAAEAYLSSYNDGLVGAELGAKLKVTAVSSYRPNKSGADQLLHGIGFAIDINPQANDWNFGPTNYAGMFRDVMTHAGTLFGRPELIKDNTGLGKSVKGKTTEEAFDEISSSNDALRRYRSFAFDLAALEAYLASEECPPSAKAKSASQWHRMITADHKRLVSRTGETQEGEAPAGFMDYEKQMVVALRDAAGLRWGGTDFPGNNEGDMMHFDGYNTEPGRMLRDRIRKARELAGEPFA